MKNSLTEVEPNLSTTPAKYSFYTEISTRLIYDVRIFPNYAIVRPASPTFYSVIRKMDINEFVSEFEEYLGDYSQIAAFLEGYRNGEKPLEVT